MNSGKLFSFLAYLLILSGFFLFLFNLYLYRDMNRMFETYGITGIFLFLSGILLLRMQSKSK